MSKQRYIRLHLDTAESRRRDELRRIIARRLAGLPEWYGDPDYIHKELLRRGNADSHNQ